MKSTHSEKCTDLSAVSQNWHFSWQNFLQVLHTRLQIWVGAVRYSDALVHEILEMKAHIINHARRYKSRSDANSMVKEYIRQGTEAQPCRECTGYEWSCSPSASLSPWLLHEIDNNRLCIDLAQFRRDVLRLKQQITGFCTMVIDNNHIILYKNHLSHNS